MTNNKGRNQRGGIVTLFSILSLSFIFFLFLSLHSSQVFAFSVEEFDSEEFEGIEQYVETKKAEVKKPTLQPPPPAPAQPEGDIPLSDDSAPSSLSSPSPSPLEEKMEEKKREMKSFWVEKDWTMEIIFAVVIAIYAFVYFIGSRANHSLARQWYLRYAEIIRTNYMLVGYGAERIVEDSKFAYSLKTTGRSNCLGGLYQLSLKRRQDLFSILMGVVFPEKDTITIDIPLTDVSPLSMAVVPKSEALSFQKNQRDLAAAKVYSFERTKLSPKFVCISDTNEFSTILRSDIVNTINNNSSLFLQLYVTDSHPEFLKKKILRLKFVIPSKMEQLDQLMKLSFTLIDVVANAKLSKTALQKATTIRERAAKEEQKATHQQRQEAAERKRLEKEQKIKEKLEKLSPLELEKYNEKLEKKKLKKKMGKQQKVVMA